MYHSEESPCGSFHDIITERYTEGFILKQKSLANKVIFIMLFTIVFVSLLITFVGTGFIYNNTKKGIEREIVAAAGTLENLFNKEYPGDLTSTAYFIYRFGDRVVVAEDFYKTIDYISCSEDIEFTVFYGDMRIFTTIVNPSGSTPVGTRAMDFVSEEVIGNKTMRVYDNIDINGIIYMGCYIPIISSDGSVSGMYFAGKPISLAVENAMTGIFRFVLIAIITLLLSLIFCILFMEKMVKNLGDIKQYINKIASGDFSARMQERTLKRNDEIGEIGRDAEKLCTNLRDMVERDPLTMLLNRRSSLMKIDDLLENKLLFTVVMGDIDFFKKINDTYGHACGDYVLKEVSALLKKYAAENDAFASRWGGEEFLMVMRSKNAEEAYEVISDMLSELSENEYSFEGNSIKITMTFGISQVLSGDNSVSAINRADELLYNGKQAGRNRIVV